MRAWPGRWWVMFFQRRESAPELVPARVLSLRLSLNTPVVSAAEVPVGPARAAILVHEEADGSPNVTLGLRSLKNGDVAFYSYDWDLREETSAAVRAEAAMSFGEGMGFLFDEDEIDEGMPRTRDLALGLWQELMASRGLPPRPPRESPTLSEKAFIELDDEILLDEESDEVRPVFELDSEAEDEELAPGDQPLELAADSELEAAARDCVVEPEAAPTPKLSKFRQRLADREPGIPQAEAAQGSQERRPRKKAPLGRLKLVKRRPPGAEDEQRKWIVRLLSAF